MRITQSETYRNYLSDIETLNERFNDISQQVSSGKKLTQLKDSPAGSAELVSLTELDSEVDLYRSNTDVGSFFLGVADSTLSEVNNLFTSIYTKGSEASSETISQDARAVLATEIRSLRDQILSLANSQARGRYIFGGSQITSAPFVLDGDSVSFRGDSVINSIVVNDGLEVQLGVSGAAAFNSIFAAIDTLLMAVDGNDTSGINAALGQFSSALSQLGQVRGQVGSNLSLLENNSTILSSKETTLRERRSKIEDADMAEAAVQLTQTQSALQTAISAGGLILKQSNLFDILG